MAINVSKTNIIECMIGQKRGKLKGDPPHLMVMNPEKPGELMKINDKMRILGANIQPTMDCNQHLETGPKAVFPAIR